MGKPENILTCCRSIHKERSAPARCCRRLFRVELAILVLLVALPVSILAAAPLDCKVKVHLVTTESMIQNEKIMMSEPSWRPPIRSDPETFNPVYIFVLFCFALIELAIETMEPPHNAHRSGRHLGQQLK